MTYCTYIKYNYCTGNKKRGDIVSPKTGRPPIENPKNVRIEIRLTKAQADLLEVCAKKLNTTRTDVILKGIEMVASEL